MAPVTVEEHAAARGRLKVLLRRYERDVYRDDSPELLERLKLRP